MTRVNISRVVLIAVVLAAAVEANRLSSTDVAAQAPKAQSRSLPTFEVDRAWPKVPPQWKLGDPSSIAIGVVLPLILILLFVLPLLHRTITPSNGSCVDPDGRRCAAASSLTGDKGLGVDPNG